ncbi:MAG: TolC family protein, partial [Planctomycetota bacterium]
QRAATEKLVAAGLMAPIETQRAEAEFARASADVAASEAAARAHELEFAFALGFERPVALVFSDGLTRADGPQSLDLEQMLTLASLHRQELAAANEAYAAELERLHLAASRVSFLPVVGAGPRSQGSEVRGVASLDVVLPIFDRGSAAKHAQDAELLAAAAHIRAAAHGVANEVCAAADRLRSATEFRDSHAHALSLRRRRLREDSERLFSAGELDYSALALARRDEVESRLAELDAELAVALARIDLSAAQGDAPVRP